MGIGVGAAVSILLASWPSTEEESLSRAELAAATSSALIAPNAGTPDARDSPDSRDSEVDGGIAADPQPSPPESLPSASLGPAPDPSTPDQGAADHSEATPDDAARMAALPGATPLPERTEKPLEEPPAWLRNAVAMPDVADRPMIAIVIDDLGLNRFNAKRVIALPGPLTLAFMTYAEDLARQTGAARDAGHELIVHLPMEPLGSDIDSGPNSLDVDLPPDELLRRLRWGLDRFDGYVGINNHMGSRFTGWDDGMALVLEELQARGLLFLDSRTVGNSVARQVAQAVGVPFAGRDVFLDNEDSVAAVRRRLAETEAIARRHGFAVAIGHPHDGTIEALRGWLPTLADRGYVLVPISTIVQRNLAVEG